MPLDFENILTKNALVDSGAYLSAIAQNELDTKNQQAPNNFLKTDDPPKFQEANGQSEKPLATTILMFDIGDNIFAEYFVRMKKMTRPIIALHFLRTNSVVIDTTHGLVQFSHLKMQVKTASSKTDAKHQPVFTDEALTISPRTGKTLPLLSILGDGIQQVLRHRLGTSAKRQDF